MPDFTDNLKPASPDGPTILAKERSQSDLPEQELSRLLLSRDDFLGRQERILRILEKDPLFNKVKQFNLSRPERYQLGLARAKKIRRYEDQYGWDRNDVSMAQYLCDDVSPFMVHYAMFVTTIREQASDEQKAYWMPKIEKMEVIGCYAQ
jgi:acyl-CoA oxidase